MRKLYTIEELARRGMTEAKLRTAVRQGRCRRAVSGVYAAGPEPVSVLDWGRATALITGGIAVDELAGKLLGYEGVRLVKPKMIVATGCSARRPGVVRARVLPTDVVVVEQVKCTGPLTTLHALARKLDDDHWEQALESALRVGAVSAGAVDGLARQGGVASRRIRRVIARRGGFDLPPTESLLETLMVQLARRVPGLPQPTRQVRVFNRGGVLIARVDLAWPELGLFLELDGEHHLGQPLYDASRQTAVVAATGWLCGRFTWTEVVHHPAATARRLGELLQQARNRPVVATSAAD